MELPLETLSARSESMRVPLALKRRARERIAALHAQLGERGFRWPMPTVSFELRGRTAGQALWPSNHIRLNAVLFIENPDAFERTVIGHELAHLATHARWGTRVRAHGPQWQAVMRTLGLAPERCHTLDTSRSSTARPTHRYACRCSEPHWLTPRRHALARTRGYVCRRCGQALRHAPLSGALSPPAPSGLTGVPSGEPVVRAPTPAMLSYARDLARKTGLELGAEVLLGFEACRAFIERARQARACEPAAEPTAGPASGPASRAPAPSEGQLRFARGLAARLGVPVPQQALASRAALARWLDEQGARLASG